MRGRRLDRKALKRVFKKVPALEKCFSMLEHLAGSKHSLGISEMARDLGYHKGTIYNIVYTLKELGVLEQTSANKFRLGPQLYLMGRAAGSHSELIRTVHPYLEEIHRRLNPNERGRLAYGEATSA